MDAQVHFDASASEPAGQAAQALDFSHLARFTLGDETLECEVLALFTDENPRRIEALRSAKSDIDWKLAAHTLKGSARAVGAWPLALAAQEAEALGGIHDWDACLEAIGRIEVAVYEVEAQIRLRYPAFAA